jgi:ADP-glucose pyrophosphorylase
MIHENKTCLSDGIGLTRVCGQVKKETATNYGCIVSDPSSLVLHYVEKPESWISNMVNGGVYRECGDAMRRAPD